MENIYVGTLDGCTSILIDEANIHFDAALDSWIL